MQNSPTIQPGVLDLITQSGPLVQLVLLMLVFASVLTWAVIFAKWKTLKAARIENDQFLNVFWHSPSIEEIFSKSDQFTRSPVASVFKSGFKELKKLTATDSGRGDGQAVDNINRALMRASNAEVGNLEKHVGWLATTASAAPFVGLFGTVWGIMNSFQGIGATGSASLAVVAPGISEALIATAAGLAAAIPAVVAYNFFSNQIRRLAVDMDCFAQDFLHIIQRSVLNDRKGR